MPALWTAMRNAYDGLPGPTGRTWKADLPAMGLVLGAWALIFTSAGTAGGRESPRTLAEQLPRIRPVEPADALKTFTVQKGFRLELVAAEPLVADPVDGCFDAAGRMYVAEMHGYPFSQEPTRLNPKGGGKKDAGIIRLLEDTDGDGTFDRSVRFADRIRWPTSVCPYDGGVFVLAPPHIWYFKDTDGDDIADVRRIVLTGFGRDNVQSVANNMKWGLDNRIYLAGGRNPGVLKYGPDAAGWAREVEGRRSKVERANKGGSRIEDRGSNQILRLGSVDLSFDPKTLDVRPETGGVQFGHSFDDWGNRFVCSNSNHIQHVVYPYRYLNRNAHFAVPNPIRSIAKEGAAAPVFRKSPPEPWRIVRTRRRAADPDYRKRLPKTELVSVGFFTSATGVTIYRGDAYPAGFRGNAFIGDVGGNLVHRKILRPNGVSFTAERADKGVEFITSTDNWFRPVNFVNGPDGCLYILDMYRETIEHPHSIPEDIKAHLHLESGDERGRVYRLVPPNFKQPNVPDLARMPTAKLAQQLESANAWHRETAQRLLWERQDRSAVAPLEARVRSYRTASKSVPAALSKRNAGRSDSKVSRTLQDSAGAPLGRLHALYALDGLDAFSPEVAAAALRDPHPGVCEHALRLCESLIAQRSGAADALRQSFEHTWRRIPAPPGGPAVRPRHPPQPFEHTWRRLPAQLACSLGELPTDKAVPLLARLAAVWGADADVRTAILTSVSQSADRLAVQLLEEASNAAGDEFKIPPHIARLIAELGEITGAQKSNQGAVRLLRAVSASEMPLSTRRLVVQSLGKGLSRRGSTVQKLLESESVIDKTRRGIQKMFAASVELALNDEASTDERLAAVGLLGHANFILAKPAFDKLLRPNSLPGLQVAAVRAVGRHPDAAAGALLLWGWRNYSPGVRKEVIEAMLQTPRRTSELLAAVGSGRINGALIDRDKKQLLMNHPNGSVRRAARKLFGGEVAGDRAGVVEQFQNVLDLNADAARGANVFKEKCAQCHRVGDVGHQVAPELASVANKSPADLLIALLDPNRELQPNFTTYTVVTKQGTTASGIIAAETASSLTLRRAEGRQDVILRSQIEQLVSSGKSLMPEGLEKDLTPQQMADVIAFVKSIKPRP